jgi:glycosyltransferase involved in cell wall biosynthesis
MSVRYTVLLPAYNEGATIEAMVRGCAQHTPTPHEVLVVDDGSTDDTARRARDAGARVVSLPRNRGKGVALREGIDAAQGDIVVMLDADGQDDPAEIPTLLAAMDPEVDMVVGSRFLGTFHDGAITRLNYIGNRFLTEALNVLFRVGMTDTLAGFKAIRTERLRTLRFEARRYDIEVELLIGLLESGARVIEVPVSRSRRVNGSSRLDSFRDGARVLARIVRLRVRSLTRRSNGR